MLCKQLGGITFGHLHVQEKEHYRCAGVDRFQPITTPSYGVMTMSSWMYVIVLAILLFGIYAFLELAGARTRWMTRHTERTAESMYDNYRESPRAQRRSAKRHDGK